MDAEPTVASRATALGSVTRRSRGDRRKAEHLPGAARRVAYLYVLPVFVLYAAFNLFPLVQGVNISLYDWDGITPGTWVGLRNYADFFSDPAVRTGYSHVLVLMIFYAFLPIVMGLFLAALMARIRIRGLTFFRLLLFLPLVITDVVTALAWTWMYDLKGPISTVLNAVGLGSLIPSQGWLGSFSTALPSVGVFGLWGGFGFCLILFLAGIMKISASLYEAARVDGANAWREFWAVTFPGLRYELQVVLVLSVIGTLDTFDEVYVMTGGGPGTATTVPAYAVWRRLFETGQVGSAAALGIVLMLIIFAITYGINRLMERGTAAE
jgi:raffinose/stachyose/melibiose transport system permease protein